MTRKPQMIATALILMLATALAVLAQTTQSRGIGQANAAAAASRAAGAPAQKPAPGAPPPPQAGAKTPPAPPAAKSGERRDPFTSTIKVPKPGEGAPQLTCPPGVRGIIVGQVELNGVARTSGGFIAVVTTTNTGRTYFLREGNTLCNGRVVKIGADAIAFEENAIDPAGKPMKREVIRKIPADAK